MAFLLCLTQNGGIRVSEDFEFKNFPGKDAPGPPTWAPPESAAPLRRTPSPKKPGSAPVAMKFFAISLSFWCALRRWQCFHLTLPR